MMGLRYKNHKSEITEATWPEKRHLPLPGAPLHVSSLSGSPPHRNIIFSPDRPPAIQTETDSRPSQQRGPSTHSGSRLLMIPLTPFAT